MKRWITQLLLLFAIALGAFVACNRGEDQNPTQVPATWEEVRGSFGHTAHLGKQYEGRTIACGDCHDLGSGGDAAIKSPGTAPCAKCHAKENDTHHVGAKEQKDQTTCLTCHAFGKEQAATCQSCHAQPKGKLAHHARTDVACTSCHRPHDKPNAVPAECTSCHVGIDAKHGKMHVAAPNGDAGVDAIAAWDAGKDAEHPATMGPTAQVCTNCHTPHAGKEAAQAMCATCHEDAKKENTPQIHAVAVAGHPTCTTCHAGHDAKKEDVKACADCHAARTDLGKGHLPASGSTQCIGCHQPHAVKSAPASCTSCHTGHNALASQKVEAHANCTSCHDPHKPKQSPKESCVGCHTKVHPAHGPPGEGKNECVTCHTPHPKPFTEVVKTCSSCHNKAASDTAFHDKTGCAACHRPHDFDLKKSVPTLCGSCHAQKQKIIAKGHANCESCHGVAHTPTREVDCTKCHEKEHGSAPKGHLQCQQCHEPHGGLLVQKTALPSAPLALATTKTFCGGTCHADKPKQLHGNIDGGCANCHRPHGPKGTPAPPACTTCHTKEKLPGLHAMPNHATCTNCHGGHKPPQTDRQTCTATCHEKQRNHQPGAKVCNGCHVFRAP